MKSVFFLIFIATINIINAQIDTISFYRSGGKEKVFKSSNCSSTKPMSNSVTYDECFNNHKVIGESKSLKSNNITGMEITSDDVVWVATENAGIGYFKNNNWYFYNRRNSILVINNITRVIKDKTSNILYFMDDDNRIFKVDNYNITAIASPSVLGSTINCGATDSLGRLWLGGHRKITYLENDSWNTIYHTNIAGMVEDIEFMPGKILLVDNERFKVLDTLSNEITKPYGSKKMINYRNMIVDELGNAWVLYATEYAVEHVLFKYDGNTVSVFNENDIEIFELGEHDYRISNGGNGKVYISSSPTTGDHGFIFQYNLNNFDKINLPLEIENVANQSYIRFTSDSSLWMSTGERGICKINPNGETTYYNTGNIIPSSKLLGIAKLQSGEEFVLTISALLKFNPSTKTYTTLRENIWSELGNLFIDKDENVWISRLGSNKFGNYYEPQLLLWNGYSLIDKTILLKTSAYKNDYAIKIVENSEGEIVFAGAEALYTYDGENVTVKTYSSLGIYDELVDVSIFKDTVWLATLGDGIHGVVNNSNVVQFDKNNSLFTSDYINWTFYHPNGRQYVQVGRTIYSRLNNDWRNETSLFSLSNTTYHKTFVDENGFLWMIGYGSVRNQNRDKIKSNSGWVLMSLDESGNWQSHQIEDELSIGIPNSIHVSNGDIQIGGKEGLMKFRVSELITSIINKSKEKSQLNVQVVNDVLNLYLNEEGTLLIHNLNGVTISSSNLNTETNSINLSNVPYGMYIAHFISKKNGKKEIFRILKVKK